MPPPLLVCDFDGTLTEVDVGDALCERLADPAWLAVEERWRAGELSLPDAQRQMWRFVSSDTDTLVMEARRIGTLRAGANELFAAVAAGRLELVIASGGFGLYIEALLGERLKLASAAYYSLLEPNAEGARCSFPHDDLACPRCAVCKANVLRRHGARGRRVAFCGDGLSDRCAAGVAPELFALEDSRLAAHCNKTGIPYVGFHDLRTVVDRLLD